MKMTLSILFFVIFLFSCLKAKAQEHLTTDAFTFHIEAQLSGFNSAQKMKLQQAFDLIKRVVALESFKKRILNHKFKGKKTFADNDGLTNAQIYQKILDGAERLGDTSKNNTMDLELELYFDNDSIALGYTYPSVQTIWLNKKYYNKFKTHQVAGNLFHEWLHKLGFKHDSRSSDERPYSVPYAVGYIIRDLARPLR